MKGLEPFISAWKANSLPVNLHTLRPRALSSTLTMLRLSASFKIFLIKEFLSNERYNNRYNNREIYIR